MSIYIPGKPMPPNCAGCDFCADGWCYVISADQEQPGVLQSDKRPDWCPLVEVPPHGRLKDADAIIADAHATGKRVFGGSIPECSSLSAVVTVIDNAPTIIPASGGNENE